MPQLPIADKTTLDAVNTKTGANTDVAGTTTIFARLVQIYEYLTTNLSNTRATKIDSIDAAISSRATQTSVDTISGLVGTANPSAEGTDSLFNYMKKLDIAVSGAGGSYFGDGQHGALTATTTYTSVTDGPPVIKMVTSINIPAGNTVTVNNRCGGLIIFCQGDAVINGTLHMNSMGGNFSPNALTPFINYIQSKISIGGLNLIGGAGGAGGAGGNASLNGGGSVATGGAGGAGGNPNFLSGARGGGGGGGAAGHWYSDCSGAHYYSANGGAGGASSPGSAIGSVGSAGSTGATQGRVSSGGGSGGYSAGGGGAASKVETSSYTWACTAKAGGAGPGGGGGGAAVADWGYSGYSGGVAGSAGAAYPGGLIVLIVGGNLTIGSTGVISANGGNGGNGGAGGVRNASTYYAAGGGGGGGSAGGGVVVLLYGGTFSNSGSITVNAGTPGSGAAGTGTGGGSGTAGTAGTIGTIGTYKIG